MGSTARSSLKSAQDTSPDALPSGDSAADGIRVPTAIPPGGGRKNSIAPARVAWSAAGVPLVVKAHRDLRTSLPRLLDRCSECSDRPHDAPLSGGDLIDPLTEI